MEPLQGIKSLDLSRGISWKGQNNRVWALSTFFLWRIALDMCCLGAA